MFNSLEISQDNTLLMYFLSTSQAEDSSIRCETTWVYRQVTRSTASNYILPASHLQPANQLAAERYCLCTSLIPLSLRYRDFFVDFLIFFNFKKVKTRLVSIFSAREVHIYLKCHLLEFLFYNFIYKFIVFNSKGTDV